MLEVVRGDLLDQDVEAIVNPWNRNTIPWWLLLPQGVSGAIKRQAGISPFRELAGVGRMRLGQAAVTGAGQLPFRAIIHVAGIDDFWRGSEEITRLCVRNALIAGAEFESVAFPLIGSGSGRLSPSTAEATMRDELANVPTKRVVLVLFDSNK